MRQWKLSSLSSRKRKMNKIWGNSEMPPNLPKFAWWESQKENTERERSRKNVFEDVMAQNSSNLMKDMNIYIKIAQQTSSKINSKRLTPRHIVVKLCSLENNNKNDLSHTNEINNWFLIRNHGVQRAAGWWSAGETTTESLSTKKFISGKITVSFKNEGDIKTVPDAQKLRGFVTSTSILQEILKVVLQAEIREQPTVTQSYMKKQRTLLKVNT